jgi:asparagine N-glycosylation enzyme membrane subunit Stt3
MLVILAAHNYQNKIDLSFYSVGALGLMVLYWYSWAGAIWLGFIFAICLTIWVFLNTKSPVLMGMYLLGGLGIIAGLYFISPDGFIQYVSVAVGMFSIDITATVTEEMSLFFSFGKFDLNTSWLYFGITFYLVLIGLGWLVYRYIKDRKPADLVFLVWAVIALGMTISRRRFDYYFAINASIIASFVLVSISMYLMKNKAAMVKIMVVLMIAVCLPLLRADYFISTANTYMPTDWRNATVYLNRYATNKPYYEGTKREFGVFSWWDYGYWILEESHLPVFCTPGTQDKGEASSILLCTDPQKAVASLRTLNLRFVVVDEDMLKDKWYPISKGVDVVKEDTLVYKLCNEGAEGFTMVYESGKVKVYEVK